MQVPAVARRGRDRVVGKDRGVVDEAPDKSELALGMRQQCRGGFFIGEIGGDRNRPAAAAADSFRQALGRTSRAMIMDGYGKAVLGQSKS